VSSTVIILSMRPWKLWGVRTGRSLPKYRWWSVGSGQPHPNLPATTTYLDSIDFNMISMHVNAAMGSRGRALTYT